jgi:dihydrolipoamide dehydrogenase
METYDVAVLGGGPGGSAAALATARAGKRTCVIEPGPLGGTCLNVGCIPTKAMLHAGELRWEMTRRWKELGLAGPPGLADGRALMRTVAEAVASLRKGLAFSLDRAGVQIIAGRGKLAGPGLIDIERTDGKSARVSARDIVIATGSAPARPALVPWEHPGVMTTDQAATATDLPASVLIIGGGVIGVEFATLYAELGAKVTLVEMLPSICSGLDDDARRVIERSLGRRGVQVLGGARITQVQPQAHELLAMLADGTQLRSSAVLAAVGRRPNVEGIGLEAAGIGVADGVIAVDDRCRTSVEHVYAIGDVAERRQYAHLATRMGEVAAANILGQDVRDDRRVVPVAVFTHPEVATVGLTLEQARAEHPRARAATVHYRATGAGWAYDQKEGFVKLVADGATGRILGASVVGCRAADVIQELTLALRTGATVADVAAAIHVHPTFVEAVGLAAQEWLGGHDGAA